MTYAINGWLYHHGILGQKWGKTQGPPYPLDAGEHSPREKKFGYKKSIGGESNEELYEKNRQKVNKIENKDGPKGDSSKTKSTTDNNSNESESKNTKKKQTYRQKLEAKYRESGLSDEEAAKAADKKIKVMKGVAIAAGVTALTIGGAVAYKKLGAEYFGRTIRKGTNLHTLTMEKDRTQRGQAFFAALNKGDAERYRGMFGKASAFDVQRGAAKSMNENKLDIHNVAKTNIKVASRGQGRKALTEMLSAGKSKERDELVKDLRNAVASAPAHYATTSKNAQAIRGLQKKIKDPNFDFKNMTKSESKMLYDLYNLNLVDDRTTSRGSFYRALKKKGFGGVLDINDYKYSGYNTKSPTIIFDENKLDLKSIKRLTDSEIKKASQNDTKRQQREAVGKAILQTYGLSIGVGAAAGVAAGANAASKAYDAKQARKGAAKMSPAERKASLEKQASKYVNRYNYGSQAAYNKAKENWVNSQLAKIEKEQKKA